MKVTASSLKITLQEAFDFAEWCAEDWSKYVYHEEVGLWSVVDWSTPKYTTADIYAKFTEAKDDK